MKNEWRKLYYVMARNFYRLNGDFLNQDTSWAKEAGERLDLEALRLDNISEVCENCHGKKILQIPCPEGKLGCLVMHYRNCGACDGTGKVKP